MKVWGYCRISRAKQSIERQVRNIKEAFPNAHIIEEVFTGTTFDNRKELDKLIKVIKTGDTIVFDSASRMSRNESEAIELYEKLYKQGINLVFLKEPHINTETYKKVLDNQIEINCTTGSTATDNFVQGIIEALNRYTIDLAKDQIRLVFAQAQKEVDDLHIRTKEGIETARLDGKQIGQKQGRKLNIKKAAAAKEIILKHSKDFNGTLDDIDVIKLANISRNSYYKYKREVKESL